jgi:putative transposase
VNGEVYHVFNRSIASQTIFNTLRDYGRFVDVVRYYRFQNLPLRFSHFKRLNKEQKVLFAEKHFHNKAHMIDILAFCVMPNHLHFLLQPLTNNSISYFMRNIQNSYSKYYNTKYERNGSLFQFMFKAVRIDTDEQLLHVSRYIHLNPVTAYLIGIKDLASYPWSSFRDYLNPDDNSFVKSDTVLNHFPSREKYREFVFDQGDYQRELSKMKHLFFK